MDCSLAKPQADQKTSGSLNAQKSVLHPSYPPRLAYGMVGGAAYGALGAGYVPTGFAQVKCNPFQSIPNLPCHMVVHLLDVYLIFF